MPPSLAFRLVDSSDHLGSQPGLGHSITPRSPTVDLVEIIDENHLAGALGVGRREVISLVGGGGKTSTLFALGRTLPGGAALTTTTKMGVDRTGDLVVMHSPTDDQLRAATGAGQTSLVWAASADGRAMGFPPSVVDRWAGFVDQIVVEADGSRGLPFKAPASFEPVIPGRTSLLVNHLGATALGHVIADVCFRPDRVATVAGCGTWTRLTPERAATVLTAPRGGRKGMPALARQVVVATGVTSANVHLVEALADSLGSTRLVAVAPNGVTREVH